MKCMNLAYSPMNLESLASAYTEPMEGTRTVTRADGTFGSEPVLVEPWLGGATPAQLARQAAEGDEMAQRLFARMESHDESAEWDSWGDEQFAWIRFRCLQLQELVSFAVDATDRRTAGIPRVRQVLRDVIADAFQIRVVAEVDGTMMSLGAHYLVHQATETRHGEWRAKARTVLQQLGMPYDRWHAHVALAHLLAPGMARYVIAMPFWLQPADPAHSVVSVLQGTPVGSPDGTNRVANKAKHAWETRLGGKRVGRRPGPRRGSKNATAKRAALDQYLRMRANQGVSAQILATDAEARRLYRMERSGDPAANLTASNISRRLAKR